MTLRPNRPILFFAGAASLWFHGLTIENCRAENSLNYPLSAVATSDGTVYVADRYLPGIWKWSDGEWSVYHQASKKFRTPLNAVRCLALDAEGRLLAGDSSTRDVYRFNDQDEPVPLTNGAIGIPMDIAVDAEGNLFVADIELHRIWKVPAGGGEPEEFALINAPRGLTFDGDGRLTVVCHGKNQLVRVSNSGVVESIVTGKPFRFPHDVVWNDKGVAFVSDGYAKTIWKVPAGGEPEAWLQGEPLQGPVGLAWKGDQLLIVDPRAKAVFIVEAEGKLSPLDAAAPKP